MFSFPRKIEWVGQGDVNGCGAAALAMLTGQTYDEVKAVFTAVPERGIDFVNQSICIADVHGYLAEHGYAVATKYLYTAGELTKHWPPEPFADVHLCMVYCRSESPRSHFVIMLRDGTILDPLTPEPKKIGDYEKVCNVSAVVYAG